LQSGVRDRLAIQRAEIARRIRRTGFAAAEALLAAEVERQSGLELLLVRGEESHHAAEVIVMAVREQHGVELRHVDAEQAEVVVERVAGEAEIYEQLPLPR